MATKHKKDLKDLDRQITEESKEHLSRCREIMFPCVKTLMCQTIDTISKYANFHITMEGRVKDLESFLDKIYYYEILACNQVWDGIGFRLVVNTEEQIYLTSKYLAEIFDCEIRTDYVKNPKTVSKLGIPPYKALHLSCRLKLIPPIFSNGYKKILTPYLKSIFNFYKSNSIGMPFEIQIMTRENDAIHNKGENQTHAIHKSSGIKGKDSRKDHI